MTCYIDNTQKINKSPYDKTNNIFLKVKNTHKINQCLAKMIKNFSKIG